MAKKNDTFFHIFLYSGVCMKKGQFFPPVQQRQTPQKKQRNLRNRLLVLILIVKRENQDKHKQVFFTDRKQYITKGIQVGGEIDKQKKAIYNLPAREYYFRQLFHLSVQIPAAFFLSSYSSELGLLLGVVSDHHDRLRAYFLSNFFVFFANQNQPKITATKSPDSCNQPTNQRTDGSINLLQAIRHHIYSSSSAAPKILSHSSRVRPQSDYRCW